MDNMEINESMKEFVKNCDNLVSNVIKAQSYIKENYNIDSRYDSVKNEIHIWCEDANNALMVAQAKEYINNEIGEEYVQVIFGM